MLGVIKAHARAEMVYLDLDSPTQLGAALDRLPVVLRMLRLYPPLSLRLDRTRRGWHVLVQLAVRLYPAETVALQLALGSDPNREVLNLRRALALRGLRSGERYQRFNLLFERKEKIEWKKRA